MITLQNHLFNASITKNNQKKIRLGLRKSVWKMQVTTITCFLVSSELTHHKTTAIICQGVLTMVKTTRRNVSWRLIKRFFRPIKLIIDQVSWRGLTLEHIRKLMGVLGLTLHQTSHTGLTEKMFRVLVKLFYSVDSFWAHFIDLTSSLTWRHDEEWF